jgi:hypothetical protein
MPPNQFFIQQMAYFAKDEDEKEKLVEMAK